MLQDSGSLVRLLKLLKQEQIHTAVESSLHVPWENIKAVMPYIDLFLIDMKVVGNDELHKKYTNQDSRLIHQNIINLIELNAGIKFRMVMVPGYNDMEKPYTINGSIPEVRGISFYRVAEIL